MSGENLPLVGILLRHRQHRTTAGYAHLVDGHLAAAAERGGAIITEMTAAPMLERGLSSSERAKAIVAAMALDVSAERVTASAMLESPLISSEHTRAVAITWVAESWCFIPEIRQSGV